jgi:predicted nucleic acid-binding protein
MSADVFLDTNVLIYAYAAGDRRSAQALELLGQGGTVSVQVLGEFVHVGRTKLHRDWPEIREQLTALRQLLGDPIPVTADVHRIALDIAEETGYRFFDSQIIAAAMTAHCKTLYSEDLQHGRQIEGLTIANPFV